MQNLPLFVIILFLFTSLLTVILAWKASGYSRSFIIAVSIWLALQAILGLNGFYTITTGTPPRFFLLVFPPVLMIIILFTTKRGRSFINKFDLKYLTLLHIVRIPVEITLFYLFVNKLVPRVMTFEGRNFDILSGITAIIVFYFGFVKKKLSRTVMIVWNIACLLLLFNIVITAVLSIPFSFQQFGFEQPNIALLYFPFIWLPCCIVPLVLFSHLAAIRQLAFKNRAGIIKN